MFRPVLMAGALLCALSLSACNVTSSQVAGFVISAQTLASASGQQQLVGAAQQRVVQACGFLPTAQTIAAIAKTFAPDTRVTLDLVDQVAVGICQAVGPTTAYASGGMIRRKRTPEFNGVPIRGRRVSSGG